MKKITFIGAGSFDFTRELVRDLFTFPAFQDARICLMDIDEQRLAFSRSACEKIKLAGGYQAVIEATADRRQALEGADGVIITILSAGPEIFRTDIEIPFRYGVDLCVGDTRGPAGIFRFLRTAPVLLEICRDIEKYCPDAYVLNYTNPMALNCRYLQEMTKVKITGLCHSVQHTAKMLADWIEIPMERISYLCAGINHQAFYLKYEVDGQDAYPLIREAVARPGIYNEEQVRNELFLHLGYYPTESSGHNSEYYPWFRKRKDLLETYCTHSTGWNPGVHACILNEYFRRTNEWKKDIQEWLAKDQVDLKRGQEYAACIFNALFGDQEAFSFNGNVRNEQYITNLPDGCCVEVPVTADERGIHVRPVGELPEPLAMLIHTAASSEELAVKGCIRGDRRLVYYAVLGDPLTSAVLSMEEIRQMVDEMFSANEIYLPQFTGMIE
ncbi:alpha-galactosidase [Diplocloster hominis]|uniref:alpha-galactosidase n=1 Tax=Diplocloster hominis TaxID=3079010 RepID=UPI0031BA3B1F